VLRPSDRAPGLLLGDGVVVPDDAEIGGHVVIHSGVALGRGVQLQDGAIIGKPPALGPRSTARLDEDAKTLLGDAAVVSAAAVLVAGAAVGTAAVVGDQAHVRERAVIGAGSVVGRASQVDRDAVVGERVRIQSGCYLTAGCVVEDDVFIGPGVLTFNDNTMGRHPRSEALSAPILRRACRVGGGALILPGVEVGEEAFVATGSVVTRAVLARTLVMGSPAKRVRDVVDEELLERWL
jgi:acetyltransferase-like isoleucine patch superfamily enzyme